MVIGAEDALLAWMAPYAERMYARFPEMLMALGDPELPQVFDLPNSGHSRVELTEAAGRKVLRVSLGLRHVAPAPQSPYNEGSRQIYDAASISYNHQPCGATAPQPVVDPVPLRPHGREGRQDLSGVPEQDRIVSRRSSLRHAPGTGSTSSGPRPRSRTISIQMPTCSDEASGSDAAVRQYATRQRVAPSVLQEPSAVKPISKLVVRKPRRELDAVTLPTLPIMGRRWTDSGLEGDSSEGTDAHSVKSQPATLSPANRGAHGRTGTSLSERRGLALKLKAAPDAGGSQEAAKDLPVAQELPVPSSDAASIVQPQDGKPKGKKSSYQFFVGGRHQNSDVIVFKEDKEDQPGSHKAIRRINVTPVDVSVDDTPLSIPRWLPGAFPSRRTVFFFDWDDTLCPTTWIRSLLKEALADMEEWVSLADMEVWAQSVTPEMDWRDEIPGWFNQPLPDEPAVRETVAKLQEAVIDVLNAAQAFGVACIVTNAVPGWVEKTIQRWLPKLKQYIHGHGSRPPIRVLYGQQAYVRPRDQGLPWVDDIGEHMWWKHAAMTIALDEVDQLYRLKEDRLEICGDMVLPATSWCASGDAKRIAHIISMGDNEAEMQAAQIAGFAYESNRTKEFGGPRTPGERPSSPASCRHDSRPTTPLGVMSGRRRRNTEVGVRAKASHWPWVKLVKFRECPHVRQLRQQLEEVAEMLPQVVAMRQHFRVDLERGHDDQITSPLPPCKLKEKLQTWSDPGNEVEMSLRVQTV